MGVKILSRKPEYLEYGSKFGGEKWYLVVNKVTHIGSKEVGFDVRRHFYILEDFDARENMNKSYLVVIDEDSVKRNLKDLKEIDSVDNLAEFLKADLE